MSDLYRELILDHARHPRGFGELADVSFHYVESNASCGDRLDVALRVGKDGVVEAMGFTGGGCVISMATASLLSEHLVGRPVVDLPRMGLADIEAMLGTPMLPTRTRCALLALRALQNGYKLWKTV